MKLPDDLTAKKFGRLTALKYLGYKVWECECHCGNIINASSDALRYMKSCGCERAEKRNQIIGRRYGHLVVLEHLGATLRVRCDCGEIVEKSAMNILQGRQKCCGHHCSLSRQNERPGNARKVKVRTTSRFKGVCYHVRRKRWTAQIRSKSGSKFLGYFEHEESAARAYDAAAVLIYGIDNAMTNLRMGLYRSQATLNVHQQRIGGEGGI